MTNKYTEVMRTIQDLDLPRVYIQMIILITLPVYSGINTSEMRCRYATYTGMYYFSV